jgi:hypothetical protein
MPGKMTMSDRPKIGKRSGNELEETLEGASVFPAAPRMLINSVSGEVMIANQQLLDARRPEKFREEMDFPRR